MAIFTFIVKDRRFVSFFLDETSKNSQFGKHLLLKVAFMQL